MRTLEAPSMGSASSDLGAVLEAHASRMRYVESTFGGADLFMGFADEQADTYKALGIGDMPDTMNESVSLLMRDLSGESLEGERLNTFYPQYEELKKYSDRIDEIKKSRPEIKTFRDILKDTQERAKSLNLRPDLVSRGGILEGIAGFVGDITGYASSAITGNDPTIYLMGVGGVGKTAGMRVATEAGFQAGIEAINQFTGVSMNKRLLGLEHTTEDKIRSIAAVAAFGGGMRAVGEYGAPLFRNIEAAVSPNRAFARVMRDEVERTDIVPQSIADILSSEKRIERGLSNRDSTVRAVAIDAENSSEFVKMMKLYGEGRQAEVFARADLQRGIDILSGRPVSMTADVRMYSGKEDVEFDIGDFDAVTNREVYTAARQQNPQLFEELSVLNRQLNTVEDAIKNKREELNNTTVSSVVNEFDPSTASRIKAIEDRLDSNIPRKERDALERELDMITQSIDRNEVSRGDFVRTDRIATDLLNLQKQRNPIATALNKKKKEAAAVVERIAGDRRIKAKAANVIRVMPTARIGKLKPGQRVSFMTRNEVAKKVDDGIAFHDANPPAKITQSVVSRVKTQADAGAEEIDFGSFKVNVNDSKYIVDSDVNGGYKTGTVADMLRELDEEDAVIKSMMECGI